MDKSKDIYFMGIAGTGMAAVAGLLKEDGYKVRGSDQKIYPPMSTMLKDLQIPVQTPYHPDNIKAKKPDLVVIANSLSRGHAELEYTLDAGIPYTSFAQILGETFLSKQESIVVSGTHGKTTTSSLLSHALFELDADPSFFIGGIPQNFSRSFRLGNGDFFVLEGDEYDTAFFDKGSKFLHYRPKILILNNIEFDHADIFCNLEAIEQTFTKLIAKVANPGSILANIDNPGVKNLLTKLNLIDSVTKISCKGNDKSAYLGISPPRFCREKRLWTCTVFSKLWGSFQLQSSFGGFHNMENIAQVLGCLSLLAERGAIICKPHLIQKILTTFKSVKKRLSPLGKYHGVEVYEDFAHHPTAVKNVINSFRASHPSSRLIVAFEPRNATSRRNTFTEEYGQNFRLADIALLGACAVDQRIPDGKRMDTNLLAATIGKTARAFKDNEELMNWILSHTKAGDSVIFMSSGDFSNIPKKFCAALAKKLPKEGSSLKDMDSLAL